jgi:hypothetical protein
MSRLLASTAQNSVRRGLADGRGFGVLFAEAAEAGEQERQQQQTALRLLQQTEDDDAARFNLPTLATAGDVREVVQYLKKKPEGVSVLEAVEDVRRRVFEPRKVAAYELWGLVRRQRGRLLLTPLGREFARRLEPASEAYRSLLRRTEAYDAALRWMRQQRADIITHTEVVAFWQQTLGGPPDTHGQANEGHVVCFFHLCQAAQLGAVTVGKRGQPARLRIDREELADYLDGAATPSRAESPSDESDADSHPARSHSPVVDDEETRPAAPAASESLRIFVSSCGASQLAAQVETTLALAGNECEVFARADADSLIPSEHEARAMRACDAAVIVVSSEECRQDASGEPALRQSLLIQIVAAVILYDGRVALLWESGLPVPESLAGLRRLAFQNDVLTWEVGIGLLKVAREFQTGAPRAA